MGILDELRWRGLVADCTGESDLNRKLASGPLTLYCGFDPTADSLHVGNLVPLLALRRFQRSGHRPIALAGGATGSIGDPSGKSSERILLSGEAIASNITRVKDQLQRLLDFQCERNAARLLDNARWTRDVSYLDFLRDIGKHFSVNTMVAKESVRARMEDRSGGISYTEFSYMLLQAFDFFQLRKRYECELQIGGSDQWGNITAGIELCRKKLAVKVYGLTLPLITNSDGTKFGKTETGAVWLDPRRTSVYRYYQFWIRTDDQDGIRYLKYFTFLSRDEIGRIEIEQRKRPESRVAQKILAKAMTELVHGKSAAAEAHRASEILFGGPLTGMTEQSFGEILDEVPTTTLPRFATRAEGPGLLDVLVAAGLCPSKGQARKDIAGGGINVNNLRERSALRKLTTADLLFGRYLLLRKGKKHYHVVRFQ